MRFDLTPATRWREVERNHGLWMILKRHALRIYGFPQWPQQHERQLATAFTNTVIADKGALHEAHIRDCMAMGRWTKHRLNDWLPQVSAELDMEHS
jgi:hypothetical protein